MPVGAGEMVQCCRDSGFFLPRTKIEHRKKKATNKATNIVRRGAGMKLLCIIAGAKALVRQVRPNGRPCRS